MAKKSKNKRKKKRISRVQREYRLYRPKIRRKRILLDSKYVIQDDKRFFRPTPDPLTVDLTPETYVERHGQIQPSEPKTPTRKATRRPWLAFARPEKSPVCQRRKARREHLFRAGKIGRGRKVSSIRRRNYNSDISCR